MSLKKYKSMRDFSSSTEPSGETKNRKKQSKKLQFVLQYHISRAKHYDFRLEHRGVLLSFAVPKGLSFDPKDRRLAVHVEDHPLEYANFEGIIPSGNYGAGSVEVFDRGWYKPVYDMDYGLRKGHLKFVLFGEKFRGEWSLIRMDQKNWLIVKSEDEFARPADCEGGGSLPFSNCDVQLASLAQAVPKSEDWIFEIKYDGYRMVAYKDSAGLKVLSRNGRDLSGRVGALCRALNKIDEQFVADGELVAFDRDGRSDFGLLQRRLKSGEGGVSYVIFDILALGQSDLRDRPLLERKKILRRLFARQVDGLLYSDFIVGEGEKCLEFAIKNGLEGVVAKKASSKYSGGRNGDWLKIKCGSRQEFVVGGFAVTEQNSDLSALLLGFYRGESLIYVGKVGTGFSEAERAQIGRRLQRLIVECSPFANLSKRSKGTFFVQPKVVAEVKYRELTEKGLLRQAVLLGFREDKDAKSVKLEVE